MHRHMRIHEKELTGSTTADSDSPQSLVLSPGSRGSPRGKKRPSPKYNSSSSVWPQNLFDDGKVRKLQAGDGHSPVKKFFDVAVDLRHADKIEACSDELSADGLSVSASSSQQVDLLHSLLAFLLLMSYEGFFLVTFVKILVKPLVLAVQCFLH